jgi:hypothetical protein
MNPFLAYFIVSFVVAVVWTILLLSPKRWDLRSVGLAGAWIATVVLASLWQAAAISWLWNFLQLVLLVWLIAMMLLVIAAGATWGAKQPLRIPIVSCALIGVVVNVAAVLHFLWIATVSPGGV